MWPSCKDGKILETTRVHTRQNASTEIFPTLAKSEGFALTGRDMIRIPTPAARSRQLSKG